jgi:hypothetical protein
MNFCSLKKIGLLLVILSILTVSVIAVHTVEELYEQGERTNSAVNEVKNALNDIKTSFQDAISSVGIRLIAILTLEYVFLSCFSYLAKVIFSYWNRKKLREERDWYVGSLREETELIKRKNHLLRVEVNLMNETHNDLLRIIKGKVKGDNPAIFLMIFAGFAFMFAMMSLTFMILNPLIPVTEPLISAYGRYIPAIFAFAFIFIGIRFYFNDVRKLRQVDDVNASNEVTETRAELVDIPDLADLKKSNKNSKIILDPFKKSIVDRLKMLKGEKTDEQKKAEEEAKTQEVTLPKDAEVKVQNGLVSITAPIKETDFTIDKPKEEKQVDLPDIDEALEKKETQEQHNDESIDDQVLNVLKQKNTSMTSVEVRDSLGLTGISGHMKVMLTLKRLAKKAKVTKSTNELDKTIWSVI